jgi:hypothetical protein
LGNKLKIKFKDKHFRENIKTKRKWQQTEGKTNRIN